MLKLIVIPFFIFTCLCIYAAVEEAMQWKYGKRQTPESFDDDIRRAAELNRLYEESYQRWLAFEANAECFYTRPWNRLRLWLANIIAP